MSTNSIVPCLWLDDQAEAAARFYTETFQGSHVTATSYYPDTQDNPSGKPRGSVLTVELAIAGQSFTLLNGGPQFVINPSISFFVQLTSPDEVDRVCAALLDGGMAVMPVDSYPWSPRYGWIADRYGASWQVMATEKTAADPTVVPCLMFTKEQAGRAEEAMKLYAKVFEGGRVKSLERYAEGDPEPAGRVKHGRVLLAGHELVAMDSSPHAFEFNEAVSLQILCDDQATIDRYWTALTNDGGSEGPCGWLKDPFGVSWQVAPSRAVEWMTSKDTKARDRAFAAMLKMKKLDIATLEAAFEGR